MPEHLRSYLVISALMVLAYVISRTLFSKAVEQGFITRLYGICFAATSLLFLVHDIWLFLTGLALLSFLAGRRLTHPLALYVFLLLLIPGYSVQVPGFGIINYLISLNPWRVLSITVLLPAAMRLAANRVLPLPGKLWADKLVIIYALYTTILTYLHYGTFTGGMRQLVVAILDIFLLYFVASRSLMLQDAVRHVMVALVAAAVFLAFVGVFEFSKHWILYLGAQQVLDVDTGLFAYLRRGETLRAQATTGQPIVLGFVMMVALLLNVYVQWLVRGYGNRVLLWLLIGAGLVSAMSRGPWVGAVVGLLFMALIGVNPLVNVIKLLIATFGMAFALIILPGGEKIIDYLPWVGSVDEGNITYREMLWSRSWDVIAKSPWIGSIVFEMAPEFDDLRTGTGFVDIVNSYLGQVLSNGLIGLCLYLLIIFSAVVSIAALVLRNNLANSELGIYGRSLFGCVVGVIVTILTVSSINQVAPMVILLIGAGVAVIYIGKLKC